MDIYRTPVTVISMWVIDYFLFPCGLDNCYFCVKLVCLGTSTWYMCR